MMQEFYDLARAKDVGVGVLFEDVVQKIYEDLLKPGDIAVDVGANWGDHLFPMAKAVGPNGHVIAFEPIPYLYEKLCTKALDCGFQNITLHQYAASFESGVSSFAMFDNHKAYSGLKKRDTPFTDHEGGLVEIQVKKARIDSKMPWFRKISLMKLDIEGGEYDALRGAKRTMKKDRPVIIFENGREGPSQLYGYTKEDFYRLFEDKNYEVFVINGDRFTRQMWDEHIRCWEFVAYPREKAELANRLPQYCREVLAVRQAA